MQKSPTTVVLGRCGVPYLTWYGLWHGFSSVHVRAACHSDKLAMRCSLVKKPPCSDAGQCDGTLANFVTMQDGNTTAIMATGTYAI